MTEGPGRESPPPTAGTAPTRWDGALLSGSVRFVKKKKKKDEGFKKKQKTNRFRSLKHPVNKLILCVTFYISAPQIRTPAETSPS